MANEIILHGSFLNIFDVGTHISGEPGIGKSELALSLISKQHQLIADDSPTFSRQENIIIGHNPLPKQFLSIRGIGLIDVGAIFGPICILQSYPLQLIIHLQKKEMCHPLSHLEGEQSTKDILGCLIPCVTIPIINPRNLEVLVETIVKNYLLKVNKEITPLMRFEELLRKKMEKERP